MPDESCFKLMNVDIVLPEHRSEEEIALFRKLAAPRK